MRMLYFLISCLLVTAGAAGETDWVLVLDRSESMTQNDPNSCRFDAQKIMVDLLAQGAEESHKLTIIRFAGTPEAVLSRELISAESLDRIRQTISVDTPQGDTDIGAALGLARSVVQPEGRAADVRMVLLSDGILAGRIPNLGGKLEAEKKAYQDLGLAIHTILLNDWSISTGEREARRQRKLFYEDSQLRIGADVLRDLARKTGGKFAEVRPERGIEEILLEFISPFMSYFRQPISARVETWGTDRQLFLLLNKKCRDLKLRIGSQEAILNLDVPHTGGSDFKIQVNPYRNRSVVLVRPGENVRWPERVEFLPGPSQSVVDGDVFLISNIRLAILPGAGGGNDSGSPNALKTRVRQHEVYPLRFEVAVHPGVSQERGRSIQDAIRASRIRIEVVDGDGKPVEEKFLPAAEGLSGSSQKLYFLPTHSRGGETRVGDSFALVVRASLVGGEGAAGASRPLCRAADRIFVVSPSAFEWLVRSHWQGEPESSSRTTDRKDLEIELGQGFRLEVVQRGTETLTGVDMLATFGLEGDAAAKKLPLKDAGGLPHAYFTDWIAPSAPGSYVAKLNVKFNGVHSVAYNLRVARDDFRLPEAEAARTGKDEAKGRDLGSVFLGEKVRFSRLRSINRLSVAATGKYWEGEASSPAVVHLLKQEASGGAWTAVRQVPVFFDAHKVDTPELQVEYRGEIMDLEPGHFLIVWPGKGPLGTDPANSDRTDRFEVLDKAFTAAVIGQDKKPLPVEGGRPTVLAGESLLVRVTPSSIFPAATPGTVSGTLTWARKDVGAPQTVQAQRADDGSFLLTFPTTDFHTGAAKLQVVASWKEGERERAVEESLEAFSRTKALGITIEAIEKDVLMGQKGAAVRFRLRAQGGENPEAHRDLLSVWLSQPVSVTIGDSERVYQISLERDAESLVGSLPFAGGAGQNGELPAVPPVGEHKLVASSSVAKLGQDVAACFFTVRPLPYTAALVKSSDGTDQQVLLGAGVTQAMCEGYGAVWVSVEQASFAGKGNPVKLAGAELKINNDKRVARFDIVDGKLRSEAVPLEDLEPRNKLMLQVTDSDGRSFETTLGSLEVRRIPLKYDVQWSKVLPEEIGCGEAVRLEGAVMLRGGSRAERDQVVEKLRNPAEPLVATSPSTVLKDYSVLPPPAQKNGGVTETLSPRVAFVATLEAKADDPQLKGSVVLSVGPRTGPAVETREINIRPSAFRLVAGRVDGQGAIVPAEGLPLFVRDRLRLKVERTGRPNDDDRSTVSFKIRVLAEEEGAGDKPVASSESPELDWSPRKEGSYRLMAGATDASGFAWSAQEKLVIPGSLRLEWARESGVIRLDEGQKLLLSVRVTGPVELDKDSFEQWYVLRPEVLTEGLQPLVVDFSPWDIDKGAKDGGLVLSSLPTRMPSANGAKARVYLMPKFGPQEPAVALDMIDIDIVRGGGTLVAIENLESGPQGLKIRDLSSGFSVSRGSRTRLGYRAGSAQDADVLKNAVAAVVIASDGKEKVLDVEAVNPGLVIFTPYEAQESGGYTIRLEIRGKTPLKRDFAFAVVQAASDRFRWFLGAMGGLALLVGLCLAGGKGWAYHRDRQAIMERVRVRREKALQDLHGEPSDRLVGSISLNVAARTIGPMELSGTPSARDVEAWVDQHFSTDPAIFSDPKKNERRQSLIQSCLAAARTELLLETEKRLPVLSAEICLHESKGNGNGNGGLQAAVLHNGGAPKGDGYKPVLSLRLMGEGKLRVSTASGRSVMMLKAENFAYNGWIGKSGNQIRASVKVPGVADYSTLVIDLK